ncbi:hypothetical protein R1CP_36795 (plasmid) [Rhodococcus opacus]|uniref:Uncharacterized protein n=1 Tax=Rhodococcus opacus TaxID=37919 RepID=A0A1B1KH75_RHOOP|nr:hypothetical protein R1CP_36795 [Rhodococcus opacus]
MEQTWDAMKVLVTGGSQGIGLGIAEVFAGAGAQVVIADRNPAKLEKARARLAELGATVSTVVADVADRRSCKRMAAEAEGLLGGLDVLCANAGIYPGKHARADHPRRAQRCIRHQRARHDLQRPSVPGCADAIRPPAGSW